MRFFDENGRRKKKRGTESRAVIEDIMRHMNMPRIDATKTPGRVPSVKGITPYMADKRGAMRAECRHTWRILLRDLLFDDGADFG